MSDLHTRDLAAMSYSRRVQGCNLPHRLFCIQMQRIGLRVAGPGLYNMLWGTCEPGKHFFNDATLRCTGNRGGIIVAGQKLTTPLDGE